MSKIFNAENPKGFEKYEHGGALKAMNFSCALSETLKGSERFTPRGINPHAKLLHDAKKSCQ